MNAEEKALAPRPLQKCEGLHLKACAVNPLVASAERAEKVPTGVISRGACGSIRFYASHSALCSAHQAGKAGSFGERVGVMSLLIIVVSLSFLLNR